MNQRAIFFSAALLGVGLGASSIFGAEPPKHSIQAIAGTGISAAFDGGTCTGTVAFVDGGCVIQLRQTTEADATGQPRTLKLTSEATAARCGQTVTVYRCPFVCECPAPKGATAPAADAGTGVKKAPRPAK